MNITATTLGDRKIVLFEKFERAVQEVLRLSLAEKTFFLAQEPFWCRFATANLAEKGGV